MPRGFPRPNRPPRFRPNELQRQYAGKVVITPEGRVGHLLVHDTITVMWEDTPGVEDLTPRQIELGGWRLLSTFAWQAEQRRV